MHELLCAVVVLIWPFELRSLSCELLQQFGHEVRFGLVFRFSEHFLDGLVEFEVVLHRPDVDW